MLYCSADRFVLFNVHCLTSAADWALVVMFVYVIQVAQIASYIDPLTSATIGAASNCPNHLRQTDILDYSKTLAESILQLIYCAKEGGGNPKVAKY